MIVDLLFTVFIYSSNLCSLHGIRWDMLLSLVTFCRVCDLASLYPNALEMERLPIRMGLAGLGQIQW